MSSCLSLIQKEVFPSNGLFSFHLPQGRMEKVLGGVWLVVLWTATADVKLKLSDLWKLATFNADEQKGAKAIRDFFLAEVSWVGLTGCALHWADEAGIFILGKAAKVCHVLNCQMHLFLYGMKALGICHRIYFLKEQRTHPISHLLVKLLAHVCFVAWSALGLISAEWTVSLSAFLLILSGQLLLTMSHSLKPKLK